MKKFVLNLIGAMVFSLIAIPAVLIGMGIGGVLWKNKVDPWLNRFIKS